MKIENRKCNYRNEKENGNVNREIKKKKEVFKCKYSWGRGCHMGEQHDNK